ncbi:MAG TPA: Ig-like domain-containing protein [Burkholderiales bacterium]|nr:Ig-like domain-containing protein [Burkholderiales bacterium]
MWINSQDVAGKRVGRLLQILIVISTMLIAACGGGGGGGPGDGPDPEYGKTTVSGIGWLDIEMPTLEATFDTYEQTIDIGGSSFEPPAARRTAPGGFFTYRVTWKNEATGESGDAYSCVICLFALTYWDAYDISLAPGANRITVTVDDNAGNVGRDTITISRVVDTTAPTVTSTFPIAGASGVAPDAIIFVYFSEALTPESVEGTSVMLTTAAGIPISTTVQVDQTYAGQGYAHVHPVSPLAAGTTYGITVTTAIRDVRGNYLAAPYTMTFATR